MSQLWHGNVVAGASAEGHGILTDWYGRGDMTRERLLDIQTIAGIPREWLPAVKDAAVQLSRACVHVAGTTYESKKVRKRPFNAEQETYQEWQATHPWTARYALVRRSLGHEVHTGTAYGDVVLVATLQEHADSAPVLTFDTGEGYEVVREAVATAFEHRIGQVVYTASDVTRWLGDLLRRRLGAVRYGRTWYVPRNTRTIAEGLTDALRESGWGHSWLYPALPIATSEQLSLGLALGLQEEVAGVMADLQNARNAAHAAGRVDIGERAVESFQGKFQAIEKRIRQYEATLGPDHTRTSLDVVADALIVLDGISDTLAAAA